MTTAMKNGDTPERLTGAQESSKQNNTSFELMLLTSLQHLINSSGTLLKSISQHFNNKLGLISPIEKKHLLRIYQELNHLISLLSNSCRALDITEVVEFLDYQKKIKKITSRDLRASNPPLEVAKKPASARTGRDPPKNQPSPPVHIYYHRKTPTRKNKYQIKTPTQNKRPKKRKISLKRRYESPRHLARKWILPNKKHFRNSL